MSTITTVLLIVVGIQLFGWFVVLTSDDVFDSRFEALVWLASCFIPVVPIIAIAIIKIIELE